MSGDEVRGGAPMPNAEPVCDAASVPDAVPVVVVGGGIAGLVTTLRLARDGHRPLLLEAAAACGGVVSAHVVGDLRLDAGAESFSTARPDVALLLDDLGWTDLVVEPNPLGAWVRHARGTAPLPSTAFLGIPGHPWARDVRRIIGPAGAVRTTLDAALPARLTPGSTLGHVVRYRMGARVLERLVEPVVGGVYATDPDVLEIATVAPGLPGALADTGSLAAAARRLRGTRGRPGSAVAGLIGGMHTVVPRLLDAIDAAGGRVVTGVRATRLCRGRVDVPGRPLGWRLEVQDAGATPRTVDADAVALALPASATARLLRSIVGPDVTGLDVTVLEQPISPVRLCTLMVREPQLDRAPRGTGVLVASRARGVHAKALTHATAKWPWLAEATGPGQHVLRLSYGRGVSHGPGDRGLPDEWEVVGIAVQDASELLGIRLRPSSVVDSAVVTWSGSLPAPRPGHAESVRALREVVEPLDLAVVGAAVAGTGLAAVVADARREAATLSERLGAASRDRAGLGPAEPRRARG